ERRQVFGDDPDRARLVRVEKSRIVVSEWRCWHHALAALQPKMPESTPPTRRPCGSRAVRSVRGSANFASLAMLALALCAAARGASGDAAARLTPGGSAPANPEALPPIDAGTSLLVVAPHPDDETLCCAGVIQRVLRSGGRASVVWITSGDASVLDRVRPTLILAPSPRDTHPDHRAAGQLTIAVTARHGLLGSIRYWIVHGGEGWPSPRGLMPGVPLTAAPRSRGLTLAVFPLEPAEEDRKLQALRAYDTQLRTIAPFMLAFVRSTELFARLPGRDLP